MNRNLVWAIPVAFVLFNFPGIREDARAEDASGIDELRAAIKAQAAEIERLKSEREQQTPDRDRKARATKSFRYKDGNEYSFDQKEGAYCYRNQYGLNRCMQNWEANALECSEAEGGQLHCR